MFDMYRPVVYILLCLFWVTTMAVPTYKVVFNDDEKLVNQAKDWLRKFGYLNASPDGDMSTEEDFREAILNMRRFHGIPGGDEINPEMIRIMNMQRCGFPDTVEGVTRFHLGDSAGDNGRSKRYVLTLSKWSTTHDITYSFRNFSPDLSSEEQREALSRAVNEWTAVANINIKEVPNADESDIEILFVAGDHGDDNPFDGTGAILAHAFYPDHQYFGGDLHFDEDETFSTNNPEVGVDLHYLSLHELGHSLGIDHSSVPEAIMFPVYRGFDENLRLAKDDIAAIQSHYGVREGYQLPPDIEDEQVVMEDADVSSACSITYDAIVRTNLHIYFFKDDMTWQTDLNFKPKNHASTIKSLWQGGPSSVDAAFTKKDNSTVLLSGDSRWEYFPNSFTLKPGFPKTNNDISIPSSVEAAVYIAAFDAIVLFKDNFYWKLNRETLHVQARKVNANHLQVPKKINAAFSTDDKIYFLTGDTDFFLFNASSFQPVIGYPKDFNEEIAQELCKWCNTIDAVKSNEDNDAYRSKSYVYLVMFGLCVALLAY